MEKTIVGISELDIIEEAKKLCDYIQVVDDKKISLFFKDLKDFFLHSGKPAQEIQLECIELMIEVRGNIIKKIPELKEILGIIKETLHTIMENRNLDHVLNAMADTCLRISETLPLLSADSSFQRVISYVKNNYSENLKLESLAQLFYYNSAYLGKRFKKYTGEKFHTYLDMLRINTAKDLLQNTDMKVYEVSITVGYPDTDYFYGKFKKYTGKSPLAFRKENNKSLIFTEN